MTTATSAVQPSAASTRSESHLFGPLIDFLCLGGASLIILPAVYLLAGDEARPLMIAASFVIADLINHPHFAHSYQVFYRGFHGKVGNRALSAGLRLRYLLAGILVPVGLAVFFVRALRQPDARVLGYGGNLMLFLVGWHYIKQEYGMLILDSVLKRRFLDDTERSIFRYNGYACWLLYWLFANALVAREDFLGLSYYSLPVPSWLLLLATIAAAATTASVLAIIVRRSLSSDRRLPLTGVAAYLTTVYVWLFGRLEPSLLIFIPAFHSLQYLIVVWRYEINRKKSDAGRSLSWSVRFLIFLTLGLALGHLGFWSLPQLLDARITYDQEVFGSSAFLFIVWIFINVHHYFLDNVIWRRENPEMREHLFVTR